MTPFDLTGPLPTGTLVLEASAGTGKTYAIAALAVRYLAQGVTDAAHLVVITFARATAAELADRIRERLSAALAVLEGDVPAEDPLDSWLISEDAPARTARLRDAQADADLITTMTIHEFCGAMTLELGALADDDAQAVLVDDVGTMRDEVVRDVYLRRFANDSPPFSMEDALAIGAACVATPDARLAPVDATGAVAQARVDFAHAVRATLAERKRRAHVYTFDDQIARLHRCVVPAAAEPARERLRERCHVVLVDEFQDTDPTQWEILEACFDKHRPLVLVGDPKQAIYGFRGADISAYAAAVAAAGERRSLDVNRRSDQGVVDALNQLFDKLVVGPQIGVPPVRASHTKARLFAPDGSPCAAPVRLRCAAGPAPLTARAARDLIAADLVAQVSGLLATGVTLETPEGRRPLQGDDIAILVRSNKRGTQLARTLTRAGIAAAFTGADSVFASHAAASWLTLLRALDQPRRGNVRAAILTDFVGGTLVGLATATDAELSEWSATLARWGSVLNASGVAALFALIVAEHALGERLLTRPLGERDFTDYRHVAELLNVRHMNGLRGAALVGWLAQQTDSASLDGDRTRRLETDERAVQIMTVHRAKGLQFPVVLLPQAADLWLDERDTGAPILFHRQRQRFVDVGGRAAAGRADRVAAARAEDAEEALRVLYVAATRAQSQLIMWWARTKANTAASPLHRVLFRRRDAADAPAASYPVDTAPGDGDPAELAWVAGSGISVERADAAPVPAPRVPDLPAPDLALPRWSRQIDHGWRRTSYSGLTAGVHANDLADRADESEPDDDGAIGPAEALDVPSPMGGLPGGTAFGTAVHAVFEALDWYAPTVADEPALRARLLDACAAVLRRTPLAGVTPHALATALLPSLLTPLGDLAGGVRLADIPSRDRLTELGFEYPLGGRVRLAQVGDLLRAHLPADDPLVAYPDRLRDPALRDQPLRGFLTGSIDAVLRVEVTGQPRFVVIDYKTNRISPAPVLTLGHFTPSAMAGEMIRSHYPLQALVYSVALHRFLAARLPGYDPATHLGGVGYLFVRGMAGRDAAPTGVFTWHPSCELVATTSELLGSGVVDET